VSLEDRYAASFEQLRQQAKDDPESKWRDSMLTLLEQNTPDSLRSKSLLASAHVHPNEEEGPILLVYWIADVPDWDRLVLTAETGAAEVVIPIHSIDYENNLSESASSVVYFASVRNQDLIDRGMQFDLNTVVTVAIISKKGVRTTGISVTR